MKIHSKNIENNYMNEKFGNNTKDQHDGVVRRSFQIGWSDLPQGTISLALAFYDNDAVPVCGFSWIHWLAANIDPSLKELPENASVEMANKMVQGKNSWASGLLPKEMQSHETLFGGCAPPNGDHKYTVKLYALDKKVKLDNGFMYNDLKHAIEGSVIGSATMHFMYEKLK
ncbi:MAG: YbhB/YbcL family Raf kinase inhibitor-like protein [Metamycoplasmataceae bacterium]